MMRASRHLVRDLVLIVALLFASGALAQSGGIRFQGSFDAVVDCDRPTFVRNLAVHGEAAGVIKPDKTGSADLQITAFIPGTIHFEGQLGRWKPVPGGSGRMQITGRNHLQLIWSLPNNLLITDVAFSRQSCAVNLRSQLKPGQREYSLFHLNTFYYCGKPRVVRASCHVS